MSSATFSFSSRGDGERYATKKKSVTGQAESGVNDEIVANFEARSICSHYLTNYVPGGTSWTRNLALLHDVNNRVYMETSANIYGFIIDWVTSLFLYHPKCSPM